MIKKVKLSLFLTLSACMVVGCTPPTGTSSSTTTDSLTTTESPTNNTSNNTTGGDNMKKGTYNRPYASNYVEGIPMVDDPHIVYMNWDGFAQYYYDEAIKDAVDTYAPNLKRILREGSSFEYLENALPSITNPCQTMIITGATSAKTKNVYRYWDRNRNTVIQQTRESEAENLFQVAVKNNISTVSVRHYLAESTLSTTNMDKMYILPDSSDPEVAARGSNRTEDHFSRMQQLTKVLTLKEFKNQNKTYKYDKLPTFTAFYADDLDAIGHNESSHYGYKLADSETERMNNVLTLLKDMDDKLGKLISDAKEAGTYDKLTFFLTTDHGMNPFGRIDRKTPQSGDGEARLADLIYDLRDFDPTYKMTRLSEGQSLTGANTIAGVGMNLNMQLSWKNGITDDKLNELKAFLLEKDYVSEVKTRKELEEDGYWTYAADMIVTPKGRDCFSSVNNYMVRAQHDSLNDAAHNIFGVAWGKGIKQNHVVKTRSFNYDFGVTIAAALGITLPQANGIVLDIFTKK